MFTLNILNFKLLINGIDVCFLVSALNTILQYESIKKCFVFKRIRKNTLFTKK